MVILPPHCPNSVIWARKRKFEKLVFYQCFRLQEIGTLIWTWLQEPDLLSASSSILHLPPLLGTSRNLQCSSGGAPRSWSLFLPLMNLLSRTFHCSPHTSKQSVALRSSSTNPYGILLEAHGWVPIPGGWPGKWICKGGWWTECHLAH